LKKIELLAPAGDLEKLIVALDYGADAVYFGGEAFSLRAGAGNFSVEDMKSGVAYAHRRGKKCYLAVNIFPHNEDIGPLHDYLSSIRHFGVDAFIVSDPGVIEIIKEIMPGSALHLSTQANMTNYRAAGFWKAQGIRRIVTARELTIKEICELKESLGDDVELEAFVHGAMCMAYSGRCLLSNFMTGRDANRGMCAHPCRWRYRLLEEKRPGEYYPVEEDERGAYVLNSKDLCMIGHMPELIGAGVSSLKIEGRSKSVFYVATVVNAYRNAIDSYYDDTDGYRVDPAWLSELSNVSHREFSTGFYFDRPADTNQNDEAGGYTRKYSFLGIVKAYDAKTGFAVVEQRNKMTAGDEIEVLCPGGGRFSQKLRAIYDEEGAAIGAAPHPKQLLKIKMDKAAAENSILRKKNVNDA